jgi:squalene-hopene/tetraprenyl-beta-curcumene cyclase
MSLAACGGAITRLFARGVEFLAGSIREDGSWPIDNESRHMGDDAVDRGPGSRGADASLSPSERQRLADWLLSMSVSPCPSLHAGGAGRLGVDEYGRRGVPDADDTAGTLVALHELFRTGSAVPISSISAGIEWLLGLQNADGGIPTFCRGWTRLPFDKSAADITAHAVAAMGLWLDAIPQSLKGRTETALGKALAYLENSPAPGRGLGPLWFGNQAVANRENPVYGTSRAVKHLASCASGIGPMGPIGPICERGVRWLLSAQNDDGDGEGPPASLPRSRRRLWRSRPWPPLLAVRRSFAGGAVGPSRGRLARRPTPHHGSYLPASPIGLYFASLWYSEELYPILLRPGGPVPGVANGLLRLLKNPANTPVSGLVYCC